jgi:hypothetical protein
LACEDGAVLLSVRIPEWELESDGRILRVGDEVRFWLTFQEFERSTPPAEQVSVIQGVALPLPRWPGAEFGRHPVQINIDGGTLYWDAPEPVAGPVEVAGSVGTNNVDAPDGFPETAGVLRRVRMEWQDLVMNPDGGWRGKGAGTRYEEVPTTYFPVVPEAEDLDAEVEAEMHRQARAAYERELASGRLKPGDSFEIAVAVPSTAREIPVGATDTRWTGVLIDLEIAHSIKA